MQDLFPDSCERLRERNHAVIETGVGASNEDEFDLPSGKKWFWSNLRPVRGATGTIFGVLIVSHDITERRRTEEALRQSEEKYRLVVDNFAGSIYLYNPEGMVLFVNKAGAGFLGGAPDEFVGKSLHEILPESAESFVRRHREIMEVGEGREFEDLLTLPTGDRWFWSNVQPLRDSFGNIYAVQCISYDITDRKLAEEELRKSEQRLRTLSDAAFEGIAIHDRGMLLQANDQFSAMFGREPDELLGKNIMAETLTPESLAGIVERFGSGDVTPYEATGVKKDGTQFPIEVRVKMMEYGGIMARIAAVRDITERKKAEEDLKRHRDRLEELVQERTQELRNAQEAMIRQERLATLGELAGSISHEIRNPLGVIDTSAYYLRTQLKSAEPKLHKHLDRIQNNVRNSAAIIESLLNLTRAEEPTVERFDLVEHVEQTVQAAELPQTVKLVRRLPKHEVPVDADPQQLRMAVTNIIKNAVDAMAGKGALTITITMTRDAQATISIGDTGPGIAEADLERVFQPLFSTKARGIGFGLSIARMVAEKHGGSIVAKSKAGKGAEIVMSLPLSACK